ncbi:enoyl-CoA hydratase/isomerase family protein [Spelaeicoccus albus]|uniref:Enoyl-CoA hydratase n=1 Tax=Spelaeicoccus albus TaxID=1280376 RepID=A0A7Z0IHF0_9MICO|nr:enoyl-CoA hydratase/isomerase family protein [Spelaeicoccus albus]NYI67522.1 enoyl-CoA hydratase [Spelaeicoccus albus]
MTDPPFGPATAPGFNTLIMRESDRDVSIRLNRPDVRNAIDEEMVDELHAVCDQLDEHPRILSIHGASGIFAAGADIRQLRERGRADALRGINSKLFDRIAALPMPTIAVIDGHALGGGAELAYACDFRIGSPKTRFGNPETGLGIIAGAGATWRLMELVGRPVAKEVLLAGRILDGRESLDVHLLTELVESDELEDAAERLIEKIAKQGDLALQLTKNVMHAPEGSHPVIEQIAQAVLFETDEKHERMTRFLDKKGGKS